MLVFLAQAHSVVDYVALGVVVAYVVASVVVTVVASEVDMLKGLLAISRARTSMRTTQDRINLVVMVDSVWIIMLVVMVGATVTLSLSLANKLWFAM